MRSVNVGILGCGYWGPKLARNFVHHPHVDLAGVADLIQERAEKVAEEYRVPLVTDDPDRIIRNPAFDLVVIATPVWTHYTLCKRALEAGKHVLVMKPLTTRTEEAEELCDLARRKGLLLAVDHTFIFTGAVQKIKQLVEEEELGELYYFDSVRINLGLFQQDVNVLWDLAPHDVSIMDYLMEDLPDQVTAVGMSHGGSPTENIAYLTLRYGNSFLGHVHVNWLAPAKVRRTMQLGQWPSGIDAYHPYPGFKRRFGLKARAIARYPMYRGVARLVGMEPVWSNKSDRHYYLRSRQRLADTLGRVPGAGFIKRSVPRDARQRVLEGVMGSRLGGRLVRRSKPAPMKESTRADLAAGYRPMVEWLENYLGRPLECWRREHSSGRQSRGSA